MHLHTPHLYTQHAPQVSADLLIQHGIEVGHVDLLVGVRMCKGFVRHLDGTVQKQFSEDSVAFPLQVWRTGSGLGHVCSPLSTLMFSSVNPCAQTA